jgi:hypothetical protein
MTGIFHIVVARKPIEGTIVENCLQWGCGAINIDGCRVEAHGERTGGDGYWGLAESKGWNKNSVPYRGESRERTDQGRWPANLILGHCENCRQGTKKVKGNVPVASGYDRLNKKQAELGYRPGEYQKGEVEPGYCHTDADGKETVEVWECEENCVTMGFPQLGVSRGGSRGDSRSLNFGMGRVDEPQGFGDSGSASRFFYNFTEQESDE